MAMKFLCMLYLDKRQLEALSPVEQNDLDRSSFAYDESLKEKGCYIAAEALQSPSAAVTLRFKNGEFSVIEGPFAETEEHLGGFILIDAQDKSEVIDIASKIPVARFGGAEVRPIVGHPALENWKDQEGQ